MDDDSLKAVIRAEAGPLAVNPQDRSNGRVAWLVIQRECDEPASALHINTKILRPVLAVARSLASAVADEADVAATTVAAVAAVATGVAARRSGPLERLDMRLRLRKGKLGSRHASRIKPGYS
jgi:predicted RNA-binding protein YlxR (DUF448 family)